MFSEADHSLVLADMNLLILFANHRDAISYGFVDPRINLFPNGELGVNERFYATVLSEYLTKRGRGISERVAADYESHFPTLGEPAPFSAEELKVFEDFDKVFVPEFGFGFRLLFELKSILQKFAVESGCSIGKMTEEMLQGFLRVSGFDPTQAEAFLQRFTLPVRGAWNSNLPSRCRDHDVFPWRFRRQLSLYMRPLVQLDVASREWLVSISACEKAFSYLLGHLERARLPKEFFHSPEMQAYVGSVTNKRGHDFAEKVGRVFSDAGYSTKLEIQMTELGGSKKLGLGDIDVVSWDEASGKIYAVECKRLLVANSVREVVQRLEDFQGDKKELDSLARHLRRVEWLEKNLDSLAKFTGISVEKICLVPLLVTSEIVPMQFYKEMSFPTSQVLSFDEITKAISLV